MTTLLLVRHGETVDNVRQIMQGQTQGKLTPNGIEQARALAAELKDTPIDVFVSSDLKRAFDTCVILAAAVHASYCLVHYSVSHGKHGLSIIILPHELQECGPAS